MRAEDESRRVADERHLLNRPTDWVEDLTACLLMSCVLLAAGIALMIGLNTYRSMAETARTESADRAAVPAVLVADAPSIPDPDAGRRYAVTAQVRWTGHDGVERLGETEVRGQRSAGDAVVVWVARPYERERCIICRVPARRSLVGWRVDSFGYGVVWCSALGSPS